MLSFSKFHQEKEEMSQLIFKAEDFFDLSDFEYREIFDKFSNVWEVLPHIKEFIKGVIKPNVKHIRKDVEVLKTTKLENGAILYKGCFLMDDEIEIKAGAVIEPGALVCGPAIICENAVLRQGAYVRGSVIVGRKSVVGHTTEMKNAIMTSESKAGHFAYIGDSIVGKVNLGAGTKLANFKITEEEIKINVNGGKINTGLRKFGAILGDGVSTGCNSVTMPGTIIGKDSLIYPNTTVRGFIPRNSVIKLKQEIQTQEKK